MGRTSNDVAPAPAGAQVETDSAATTSAAERFQQPDDHLRQRILKMAPVVLQRVGLARFTMEEVAKATGIARQTVYKRFPSRDDLIVAILVDDVEQRQLPALADELARTPSAEQLVRLFIREREIGREYTFIDDVLSPKIGTRLARLLFSHPQVLASRDLVWRPILTTYQDAGIVRRDLDLDSAVRWLFYETFWELIEPGLLANDPDELAYYTAHYALQGLFTDDARAEIARAFPARR